MNLTRWGLAAVCGLVCGGCGETASKMSAQLPPTPIACCGDCGEDGAVTIDEIIKGVNNALEGCPITPIQYCGEPQTIKITLPNVRGCMAAQGQLIWPESLQVIDWEPTGPGCSSMYNTVNGKWNWMCGKEIEVEDMTFFQMTVRAGESGTATVRVDLAVDSGCDPDMASCPRKPADCGATGFSTIPIACVTS